MNSAPFHWAPSNSAPSNSALSKSGQGRVIVVGGGVLGTMHAVAARRRGLEVVHLEREPGPRGASVRNFGLVSPDLLSW